MPKIEVETLLNFADQISFSNVFFAKKEETRNTNYEAFNRCLIYIAESWLLLNIYQPEHVHIQTQMIPNY